MIPISDLYCCFDMS